ncbi:MAG: hypothetical protein ACRC6L_09900 [Steroidobacteraceae bacterium]
MPQAIPLLSRKQLIELQRIRRTKTQRAKPDDRGRKAALLTVAWIAAAIVAILIGSARA